MTFVIWLGGGRKHFYSSFVSSSPFDNPRHTDTICHYYIYRRDYFIRCLWTLCRHIATCTGGHPSWYYNNDWHSIQVPHSCYRLVNVHKITICNERLFLNTLRWLHVILHHIINIILQKNCAKIKIEQRVKNVINFSKFDRL